MALVAVSQINFRGNGSTGSIKYDNADKNTLLGQIAAVNVESVNVEVLVSILGEVPPQQVTALIAIDSNGNQLRESWHWVALPCPPYCGDKT